MEDILLSAIQTVQTCTAAFCKFISANDVGKTSHEKTRSHQSGYYIPRPVLATIFEQNIIKNNDYELHVNISWQNDFETSSRFKYFGSKNECHLTRLGKGFPYRNDSNIGDLLIICKKSKEYYNAFVLQSDEHIDSFFAALNISSTETNQIIPKEFKQTAESKLYKCFINFLNSLKTEFPTTLELATNARNCYNQSYLVTSELIKSDPDEKILNWLEAEFQLFKTIENNRYSKRIQTPFETVEKLIETANTILNRRKSRAGKSLEHHLAEMFSTFQIFFSSQATTEENKKPDFLFPNVESYHNSQFPSDKLFFLASKTTCKDRWRQVLNEADRIKTKHLFTLQQGISENQLKEMYNYNVCLVVPQTYLKSFPKNFQPKILCLHDFIKKVQATQ